MSLPKSQTILFIVVLMGIYVAAWEIQNHLLLNHDVSWLLQSTQRWLAGGTYTKNFFETNPPLILYLNILPIYFQRSFGGELGIIFRVYVFLLVTVSLSAGYYFIKQIFAKTDRLLAYTFLLAMAMTFLLLPVQEFGQRDHLLVILIMPYLMMVASRLQNIKAAPPANTCLIFVGLLAGLGFAVKPHFLIVFALIEFYVVLYKKNIKAWMRVETLTIISLLIIYIISIFLFFQDYVYIILPFTLRLYYAAVSQPVGIILLNGLSIFLCVPFLFFLIQYRSSTYKTLSVVLALATLGLIVAYAAQRTLFYYHLLPALSMAILLLVLSFSEFISQKNISKNQYALIGAMTAFVVALYFLYEKIIWTMLVFHPYLFFIFFSILFTVLFCFFVKDKHFYKILGMMSFILFFAYYGNYLAQRTVWFPHQFLITVFLLLALFSLFAAHMNKRLGFSFLAGSLGMLLFAFPVYIVSKVYWENVTSNAVLTKKLIPFLQRQAKNRPIYFFATTGTFGFPVATLANTSVAPRFYFLWMAAGLANQPSPQTGNKLKLYTQDKNFFINMLVEDLRLYKPYFVLVDAQAPKYRIKDKNFDYLTYFSEDQRFLQEWKAYRYLTTLDEHPLYKFKVYQRWKD